MNNMFQIGDLVTYSVEKLEASYARRRRAAVNWIQWKESNGYSLFLVLEDCGGAADRGQLLKLWRISNAEKRHYIYEYSDVLDMVCPAKETRDKE